MLPCLHSFCRSCIAKLVPDNNKTIKCPQCRSVHDIPVNGIEGFLSNTQLLKEISELQVDKEVKDSFVCGMCKSGDVAVCYCSNCDNYLCEICNQSHKRMAVFELHVTVSPNKTAKPSRTTLSYKCSEHPDEDLKVYCCNCKLVVCRECALYSHQRHSFKPAEKAANEIKKSIQTYKDKTANKLKEYQKHKDSIKQYEQYVTGYPSQIKNYITVTFDEYIKILNARKMSLLEEIDSKFDGYSKKVWAEKDTIEMMICSLEANQSFVNSILQADNDTEVAVLGSRALPRLRSVCENTWHLSSVQYMSPVVYIPSITISSERLENHLAGLGCLKDYGHSGVKNPSMTIKAVGYQHPWFLSRQDNKDIDHRWISLVRNSLFAVEIIATPDIRDSFPSHDIEIAVEFNSTKLTTPEPQLSKTDFKTTRWILHFQTYSAGEYIIKAKLKLPTCIICKKEITFVFVDYR